MVASKLQALLNFSCHVPSWPIGFSHFLHACLGCGVLRVTCGYSIHGIFCEYRSKMLQISY